MSGAIAIFVKTPGCSPVKTRLAAECGADYVEGWYRRAAAAVAAVARTAQTRFGASAYWAVAEPEALARGMWAGLPSIAQGEGGLGERMARVHAQLVAHHGAAVLLGADAPQVAVDAVGEALHWIDDASPRLVIGPAHDGGFWLFGGNVAPPLQAWTAVRYSAPDTAQAFRTSLAGHGEWRTLATLSDTDHRADLARVLDALRALPDPLPEQRALADWMLQHEGLLP